ETGLEGLVLEPNKGLGVNLLNVFNHISTESRVEKSFRLDPDFGPDVFSKEALSHKIPKEFYEAVYLEPYGPYEGIDFDGEVSDPRKNQEDYFFSNIIDGLQKRKIGVLAKANLETSVGRTVPMSVGVYLTSPTPELRDKVRHEEMGAYKVSPLIKEYVKFLKGNGVDIPALAPWEMIMVLPVIIRDAQKLLDLHQLYREATYNWCASQSGFFGYAKRLWNSGFGCRETYALFDDNRYRFDKIFAHKRAQLDDVLKAHIASLENLSNWLNTHGDINSLTQDEVLNIVKPTMNALDKFSDITLLDVESAAPELGRIPGLLYVVQQELSEVTNLIKAQVRARLLEAYQMYAKQLAALKAQVARIQEKIDALIDKTLIGVLIRYKKQLEAEIKNIGKELLRERWDQNVENLLGLSDDESEWRELGADMLTNFPKSVGFMNAFNSVAAVLANHEVVNPPSKKEVVPSASSPLPISFQGPVSFDASFQLEYNQAALCPELKAIVYPCGISGAEMLQPAGYSSCVPFYDRIKEKMGSRNQAFLKLLDPEAECYDIENFVEGSQDNVFSFTKNPSIRNCAFKSIEEVQRKGRGSSSLAFPPQYAPANDKPYCQLGLDSLKIIEVNR
ncbi:MAG: hypothetical protein KDD25_04310, partial [Bdellovibrionales bacterium]|nr:hypothetical protein [Bdellovibrionales bacterium]